MEDTLLKWNWKALFAQKFSCYGIGNQTENNQMGRAKKSGRSTARCCALSNSPQKWMLYTLHIHFLVGA